MGRILIIDDDPVVASIVAAMAANMGCRPRLLRNGIKLEEAVDDWRPDALVLDLVMPECDGMEVLGALARSGWDQPIFLMSAYPEMIGGAIRYAEALQLPLRMTFEKPLDLGLMRTELQRATASAT